MADIRVIIPALNEAGAIGAVVRAARCHADEVIVVDNGSTDDTAALATAAGARVVTAAARGYGHACLAGIAAAQGADVLVFLDGDGADPPEGIAAVTAPVLEGRADLVVSSRGDAAEPGSLTAAQVYGNRLACSLIALLWGYRFTDLGPLRAISATALELLDMDAPTYAWTDLGPFRAIRRDALVRLAMDDRTYGWTVQMQVRALQRGLRCAEVPVPYRRRIGVSKVSGTWRGTVLAGSGILGQIAREWLAQQQQRRTGP